MVSPRSGVWGALVGVLLWVGAWGWARQPVTPLPVTADAGRFSEARAWPLVEELADGIGPRPLGSSEADQAARSLERRLRALPGVEVERQEVSGTRFEEGVLVVYRVVNVLARYGGERPEAVLLSAHYDSPAESPGAADNGLGVATGVEVMRALAAGPRPRQTVVLNLNGGEESGRLGAAGFLAHPWARDVRAFANLDATGAAGKALLFRAGPGQAWLLEAYAAAVPQPVGSVLGQDLLGSGAVPLFTDFEEYTAARLPGVDLATLEDGYAYHTEGDRPGRLAPGTLQHLGDNTLALLRALVLPARTPVPEAPVGAFFSVWDRVMVVYSPRVAWLGVALAWALTLGAWGAASRRRGLSARGVLRGAAWTGLGGVLGLAVPLLGALLLGGVLGRPHGWFAWPWLGGVTFGALGLVGVCAAEAAWSRSAARRGGDLAVRGLERWSGALLWGGVVLLVMSAAGLGSAYVPLLWVLGGATGLGVAVLAPRWWGVGWVLAFLPGAVVTGELVGWVLALAVPLTGHLLVPFALDGAIALLVALPLTAAAWLVPLVWPWEAGGRRVLGLVGLCAVVGWGALALVPTSSAQRPRRLRAVERVTPEGATRVVQSLDGLPLGAMPPGVPDAERTRPEAFLPLQTPVFPPPRAEVLHEARHEDAREVTVRWDVPPRAELRLEVPRDALVGWSLGALPVLAGDRDAYVLHVVAPPEEGWTLTLRLRGSAPVAVRATARREGAVTPGLQALRAALAPAVPGSFAASHRITVEL